MSALIGLYANNATSSDHGRYGVRKAIKAVKDAVPVETYAATHTELKPNGMRLVGRCPIPDHEDRTPSFHIWPEGGSWWCFGCSRGGDIFDLYQAVEGGELWEAVVDLAQRFDVELPQRPSNWFAGADEKGRRRAELTRTRTQLYQRRLLRLFREDLEGIPDPGERREETRRVYRDLWHLARLCAEQRAG